MLRSWTHVLLRLLCCCALCALGCFFTTVVGRGGGEAMIARYTLQALTGKLFVLMTFRRGREGARTAGWSENWRADTRTLIRLTSPVIFTFTTTSFHGENVEVFTPHWQETIARKNRKKRGKKKHVHTVMIRCAHLCGRRRAWMNPLPWCVIVLNLSSSSTSYRCIFVSGSLSFMLWWGYCRFRFLGFC